MHPKQFENTRTTRTTAQHEIFCGGTHQMFVEIMHEFLHAAPSPVMRGSPRPSTRACRRSRVQPSSGDWSRYPLISEGAEEAKITEETRQGYHLQVSLPRTSICFWQLLLREELRAGSEPWLGRQVTRPIQTSDERGQLLKGV